MRELAALACLAFVSFLFWREYHRQDAERISWVPFFWMVIAGSRFVSAWLSLHGPGTVDAYDEGNPVDRLVFFSLILWGGIVLYRRNVEWSRLLVQNKWLAVYLVYCLASLAWASDPGILAKRWVKDLGNPMMALVLLTERSPYDAIVTTVRRLGFVLLPISVLFIRYYPEFGRAYAADGSPMYSGIADQKNTLGLSCFIIGICYVSTFVRTRRLVDRYDVVTGLMLVWLLHMANSQTSLTCLLVAASILVVSASRTVSQRPSRLIPIVAGCAGLYFCADALFHVQDQVLQLLGRDPTFTKRTDVWAILVKFQANALVGAGFMSFWTGERMASIWAAIGAPINQAHNGYLEQYLNLGYVGVGLIAAIALSALMSLHQDLRRNYALAVLRLCFLVTALLYNYTEASFYGINNMWVLFLAASIETRNVRDLQRDALDERPLVVSRQRSRSPRTRRAAPPRLVTTASRNSGARSRWQSTRWAAADRDQHQPS